MKTLLQMEYFQFVDSTVGIYSPLHNYANMSSSIKFVVPENISLFSTTFFVHFAHRHVPVKQFTAIEHLINKHKLCREPLWISGQQKTLLVQSNIRTNFPYFTILLFSGHLVLAICQNRWCALVAKICGMVLQLP